MDFKNLLIENGRRREVIRTIVKDIVAVYKEEDDGEFYLPNYVNDEEDFYNFLNFEYNIIVELVLETNYNLKDFILDGNYWRNEDIIEIIITYNPDKKFKILYDLVGQLNQLIAHEIRHIDQKNKGLFDLNVPEEKEPLKYYTQPHELDAQYFGFNRLSKLTKKPIEDIVRNWFKTNKDIHKLDKDETEIVIDKILNHK